MSSFAEVAGYFVSPFLWAGAWLAVKITIISMAVGLALGLGLALLRMSPSRLLSLPAWFYIWVVRGTPQLLQLVFIFDALPAIGLKFDSFTTAVIGFSLNQAAFSPKCCGAASCRSIPSKASPQAPSAWAGSSPSGGSFSRRRCVRSYRPSPTIRSAC